MLSEKRRVFAVFLFMQMKTNEFTPVFEGMVEPCCKKVAASFHAAFGPLLLLLSIKPEFYGTIGVHPKGEQYIKSPV